MGGHLPGVGMGALCCPGGGTQRGGQEGDSVSLKGPGALRESVLNSAFLISIISVSSYSAFCLVLIAPSLLSHQLIVCLCAGGWERSLTSLKVLRDSPVKCIPVPDLSLPPTRGGGAGTTRWEILISSCLAWAPRSDSFTILPPMCSMTL